MEECLNSNYDTYIEERFIQKLEDIKEKEFRNRIKIAWLSDKALYTDLTKTIEFEFTHYSLHDVSHSISILQYIYMLLGKDKIDFLSVGDLWLLLEAAYSHDIGMSVTYSDLIEIWSDKNSVKSIIKKIANKSDKDAAEVYDRISKCLENELVCENFKKEDRADFLKSHKYWPLEFRKAVTYINSEYIRLKHPERSKNKIIDLLKEYNHLKIEDRLYNIVGIIDYLHGEDFREIENNLDTVNTGFTTEKIHPQLIALLLRVGDALDIRNNRFDYWNIQYLGGLPKDSEEHYKKHKSVEKFLVDEENVNILINSNEIDVCNNSRAWLDIIEKELNHLICYWNRYAIGMTGLKLKNICLKVTYNGYEFITDDFIKRMKADPKKLLMLLSGKNFYNTKLIAFREFLQNAVDAIKMKIALEYYNNDKFLISRGKKRFKDITFMDFSDDILKKYQITIIVRYAINNSCNIEFEIIDQGIGMDKQGLDALFNIGKGWKEREEYNKMIDYLPDWMYPTGGFGIGVLSAFLLSDKVIFKTKSEKSPQYVIAISSPQSGGKIEKTVNNEYYKESGTSVIFQVPFGLYLKEMRKLLFKKMDEKIDKLDLTDKKYRLYVVCKTLSFFIKEIFVDMLFPISIECPEMSDYLEKIKGNNIYDKSAMDKNVYWDEETNAIVRFTNKKGETRFAYKGINIERENINLLKKENILPLLKLCDMHIESIDIFDKNVNEVLDISRNNFIEEYSLDKIIESILFRRLNYKIDNENYSNLSNLILYFSDQLEKNILKNSNILSSFEEKYLYLTADELFNYLKRSKINACVEELKRLRDYLKNNEIILRNKTFVNQLKEDAIKDLFSMIENIKQKLDNLNIYNIYSNKEKEKKDLITDLVNRITEKDIFVEKQIDILYELFTSPSLDNDIFDVLGNEIQKESLEAMLLKKNKIRIFALQNIDKYIHNMLNKEIFKEKNFYLQNLEKIKNLDFLKYYNISYKECEYLLDRKNKDFIKIKYYEVCEKEEEKLDNEKSEKESLVDYIIRIIESSDKANNTYFIIDQNIDITRYEKIVIENNPLNYKDNESIIYNPFSIGEANYRSIDPNYIVNEELSKLQIEKNFTESERFNEIIELVYSLQEDKFTSKAQINKLYLELIMEILEKKGI
ncbi:HD domain-containing protein [Thomasclavelia cocleata]|uniref:HD domain-containing protein n=2 Tax=Thomasclavelia cocleata TaxID=69824 RepID=UPI00242AD5E4|nr:ATP-binding protein [Thomasclavelia cocleata]